MIETLLILLPVVWLAVTALVVALCRMAADADTARRRALQEPSPRAGQELGPRAGRISAATHRRLAAHSH